MEKPAVDGLVPFDARCVATLRRLLMAARPYLGPIVGLTAPAVRFVTQRAPDPQRRLFWKFLGTRLSRGSWRFTVRSNSGFKFRANTVDLLPRLVYYFGVWEPHLTEWIAQQLHEGDTFIDVGANLGYYTLLASQIVGATGHVVAIEASPRTLRALKNNLTLNDACNVRVVNIAVSDRDGEVQIYDGPLHHSGITSIVRQPELRPGSTVPSKTLQAILTHEEFTEARLFKIDVEGAEGLVAAGLRGALVRTRPEAEFVIEISPARLQSLGQSPDDLLEIFAEAGFHAYQISNSYDESFYLERRPYKAPVRLESKIVQDTDIIFSRRDRAEL